MFYYDYPRLCYHADAEWHSRLTNVYETHLPYGDDLHVADLMTSPPSSRALSPSLAGLPVLGPSIPLSLFSSPATQAEHLNLLATTQVVGLALPH